MCGIVGMCSDKNISKELYYALYSMQHRGQESCGLATSNGSLIKYKRGMGLVGDTFKPEDIEDLAGNMGIGHVRYSTAGGSHLSNIQPMVGSVRKKQLAVAHNGNLVNALTLREALEEEGYMFRANSDTEVIHYILARYYKSSLVESVKLTMDYIKGAYSLVIVGNDEFVAVRDPYGFRPLKMGKKGNQYMFASEDCAISILGYEVVRDVEPGEIISIKNGEVISEFYSKGLQQPKKSCIFEHVYFARNDTYIDDVSVYDFRVNCGEVMAKADLNENDFKADMVVPVPDSGWSGAIGYSNASGLPISEGLVKNRYVGRTFIKPTQEEREVGVKIKLNPLSGVVKGKSIILIDDSIVRGTTSRLIVKSLREAGASEIHLRITSPPVTNPCYFGIDTPDHEHLIAANNTLDEIRNYIGCDSIKFLEKEQMVEACNSKNHFCYACFDGEYPIKIFDKENRKC